jgi:hypothetical protein
MVVSMVTIGKKMGRQLSEAHDLQAKARLQTKGSLLVDGNAASFKMNPR